MQSFNLKAGLPQEDLSYIASNPNTPPTILDQLANHHLLDVLVRVAENPSTRSVTLSQLAYHSLPEVRVATAVNMSTPLEHLEQLACDHHPDTRYILAENPHLPGALLERLAKDDNPFVSARAQKTLARLQEDQELSPKKQVKNTGIIESKAKQAPAREASKEIGQAPLSDILPNITNTNLQVIRDRAFDMFSQQTGFIANLSYELRTPLSAIIGMSELILSTDLTSEQHDYALAMQESAQRLLNIVEDIADMSKIEAGKVDFENLPFNIMYVIQDTARLLANAAKSKEIKLTTHLDQQIPEFVIGDSNRVREVLFNLISSCIRITGKGDVLIKAGVESESDTGVTLQFVIKTREYAISPKVSSSTILSMEGSSKSSGVPYSLALIKQLVELMGGKLQTECMADQITSVQFSLPFKRPVYAAQGLGTNKNAINAMPGLLSARKLALVVEDNEVLRTLAVTQLANLGVNSQAVASGQEAIAAVKEIAFDLILMDIHLPNMNGFEATKLIRKMESQSNRHTPIIAITADTLESPAKECIAAGMDDYLSKPVSIKQLRQKIEQLLPSAFAERIQLDQLA